MANTVTNTRIICDRDKVVQRILIVSDGSEETDLVIYDSSAVATALGKADPLTCKIQRVKIISQNAATYSTLTFEYDATTDVVALPATLGVISPGTDVYDFREYGGIVNLAGAGATGDITLTTSALDSGDTVLIYLEVTPY